MAIIKITRKRTGVKAIITTAKRLCRLIVVWRPLILRLVGNNPDIAAAFETIVETCEIMISLLEQTDPEEGV